MHHEVLQAATEIVSAFLTRNEVPVDKLSSLITVVAKALADTPTELLAEKEAAAIRLSVGLHATDLVHYDHVVCAVCGFTGHMLRGHLKAKHGLTTEQYIKDYGLPEDILFTSPEYTKVRSKLAKQMGLGLSKHSSRK